MTASPPRSRDQPPPPGGDPLPLPPPPIPPPRPPGRAAAPPDNRPPSPRLLREAATSARLFLLLAICSLVMSGRPLPWGATSLLFSVPAVWVGLRALRQHRAAGSGRGSTLAVSVGVGLAAFVVASQLLNLALWPVQWDYERCRARALGVNALERCDSERVQRLSPGGLFGSDD